MYAILLYIIIHETLFVLIMLTNGKIMFAQMIMVMTAMAKSVHQFVINKLNEQYVDTMSGNW